MNQSDRIPIDPLESRPGSGDPAGGSPPPGSPSDSAGGTGSPPSGPRAGSAEPGPGSQPGAAGGSPAPEAPVGAPNSEAPALLGIEEFARWDLRIARVIAAGPHPRADRLLKLEVDLGTERRQLVAGIAAHYRAEDLVGRLIVVVANLKPAKLRGEVSEGMLLAASSADTVSLLVPDREVPPGSGVR